MSKELQDKLARQLKEAQRRISAPKNDNSSPPKSEQGASTKSNNIALGKALVGDVSGPQKGPLKVGGDANRLIKELRKRYPPKPQHVIDQEIADIDQQRMADLRAENAAAEQRRMEQLLASSDVNPKWTMEEATKFYQAPGCPDDFKNAYDAISIAVSHIDCLTSITDGFGMLLLGDYGRGKSTLGGALYHEALKSGSKALMCQFARFINAIFGDDTGRSKTMLRWAETADLLVLDEVGLNRSALPQSQQNLLATLIRNRQSQKRATLLISNHDPAGLEQAIGTAAYEGFLQYDPFTCIFTGETLRDRTLKDHYAQPVAIQGLQSSTKSPIQRAQLQTAPDGLPDFEKPLK